MSSDNCAVGLISTIYHLKMDFSNRFGIDCHIFIYFSKLMFGITLSFCMSRKFRISQASGFKQGVYCVKEVYRVKLLWWLVHTVFSGMIILRTYKMFRPIHWPLFVFLPNSKRGQCMDLHLQDVIISYECG